MRKLIFSALTLAAIGTALCFSHSSNENSEYSDLAMAAVEANAATEPGSGVNYGPAREVKCTGKQHKKLCMCEPGYPECTETDCY
jgi:hypothetical protein